MTKPVRITVRVSPGSKTTAVVGPYLEGWKLRVTAVPESGKANDAVVRLLAELLSLPVQQVTIVAGHISRNKVVEINGLALDAVQRALTLASAVGRAQV